MGKWFRHRPLAFFCFFIAILRILLLFVGMSLPGNIADHEKREWADAIGHTIVISGDISEIIERDDRCTCVLKSVKLAGNPIGSGVLLYLDKEQTEKWRDTLLPGRTMSFEAIPNAFEAPGNPGQFDAASYYETENIIGCAYPKELLSYSTEYSHIVKILHDIRRVWIERLFHAMGEVYGGIASSILAGEKGEMDKYVSMEWQKAGFAHVLAVSGLHMSFLGSGLYRLFRRTGVGITMSGIPSCIFLLMYVLLTGGHVSAWRAFIMFTIYVGAKLCGRTYDPATSLGVAFCIVAWTRPAAVMGLSFIYSFSSIASLVWLVRLCECQSRLFSGIVVSSCVNAVLCPITLCFSYEYPIYSIFLNWILLPLFPIFAAMSFGGLILCEMCPPAGALLLQAASVILRVCHKIVGISLRLPGSRQVTGHCTWVFFVVYVLALVIGVSLCLFFKKRRCTVVFFAIIPILFCAVTAKINNCDHRLQMTCLDVGQGDCIYIKTPAGTNILVDCGSSNVKAIDRNSVTPFLLYHGVRHLDIVFVTHGDEDHINGLEGMLEHGDTEISIGKIFMPQQRFWDKKLTDLAQKAEAAHVPVFELEKGDLLSEGAFRILCLAPGSSQRAVGNEASLVMKVSYIDFDILLTGDMEYEGEEEVMRDAASLSCDVLKVPHHGSKNITSSFFEAASPQMSVISVAQKNRFGHPSPQTVDTIIQLGSELYTTAKNGAVSFFSDGTSVEIRTWIRGK